MRAITDGQGQVVARFEYEPFGVTTNATGPLAGDEVHRFIGRPEDAAIGLFYFNARYYDPFVGRFTSKDPKQIGLNWYEYAWSNPLRYIDQDGLWPSSLHRQVAERIAIEVGFTPEEAAIIGEYCERVDKTPGLLPWPVVGDLSMHFDTDSDPDVDSRVYHGNRYLAIAEDYLDRSDIESALRAIGTGLHPVGDVSAHANYNPYELPLIHPGEYDNPDLDFDYTGKKQAGSGAPLEFKPGHDRYNQFVEDTRDYLERAYNIMHGNTHVPNRSGGRFLPC